MTISDSISLWLRTCISKLIGLFCKRSQMTLKRSFAIICPMTCNLNIVALVQTGCFTNTVVATGCWTDVVDPRSLRLKRLSASLSVTIIDVKRVPASCIHWLSINDTILVFRTMPTMNMSLENVLNRADRTPGKELNDDHTVTTRGTSMCSSMRSSRTTSSTWTEPCEPRRVYFPEMEAKIVGTIPRRDDMSPEEKWETWWTTSEFQAIRLAAKFTTKHVRKNDHDGIEKIDTGFNTALHVSCTASDEELEAVLRSPPASLYGPLEGWCKRKSPVRGLEKYISNLQKELRLQYVAEARSAVVSMAKAGEHDDEDISMIYKEYSRHALVYSRFLGHTDMLAAKEEDEPEKRPRLVRRLSGFGRQISHRQLGRDSSSRQLNRQPSKRELNMQASMKKLAREQSTRKIEKESSSRKLGSSSHHRKPQKESSSRKLTREASSKKLQRESSHRKIHEHGLRRQDSVRRGVRRTATPHDMKESLSKNSTKVLTEGMKRQEPIKNWMVNETKVVYFLNLAISIINVRSVTKSVFERVMVVSQPFYAPSNACNWPTLKFTHECVVLFHLVQHS